jgi:hypothetical protein
MVRSKRRRHFFESDVESDVSIVRIMNKGDHDGGRAILESAKIFHSMVNGYLIDFYHLIVLYGVRNAVHDH